MKIKVKISKFHWLGYRAKRFANHSNKHVNCLYSSHIRLLFNSLVRPRACLFEPNWYMYNINKCFLLNKNVKLRTHTDGTNRPTQTPTRHVVFSPLVWSNWNQYFGDYREELWSDLINLHSLLHLSIRFTMWLTYMYLK